MKYDSDEERRPIDISVGSGVSYGLASSQNKPLGHSQLIWSTDSITLLDSNATVPGIYYILRNIIYELGMIFFPNLWTKSQPMFCLLPSSISIKIQMKLIQK